MDKKQERKIRIKDLKQTYKNLKNSDDYSSKSAHVWKDELQAIKNAIKFLEGEDGK